MPLTNRHLLLERPHPSLDGVQRIYLFNAGYGLSLVNSPKLHSYPFAWEAAVLKDIDKDGNFGGIIYHTPLTSDVEVFKTDDEANAFIQKAAEYFLGSA